MSSVVGPAFRQERHAVETDRIPDTPIDFTIPYQTRIKGAARHFGFFPFFAKKPWPIVQEYIKHYTRPGNLVCDPFAGSGVTPVEALVLGRRAVATDINPVARFITRMTAIAPVDLGQIQAAFDHVRAHAQAPIEALREMSDDEVVGLLASLAYPRHPIPASVRRATAVTIDELHTPRQLAGLALLRAAINQVEDTVARDLLRVGLANTVRYANITYNLPSDKGRRRSVYRGDANFMRRFSFSPASKKGFFEVPVWPTFEHVFPRLLRAKEETNRLIGERYNADNFILSDVPASRIHEITGEATVDYCFTDPPYSNEIYFLDLSVLWAAWLDLPITDGDREAELLIDRRRGKTRDHFLTEFAASMESIARALKDDAWFTLVYKGRDLSLWQAIVAACEKNGLRYVNAVWQELRIRSTRQIESPNINPKGDMYLNFRKMTVTRFEALYGRTEVLQLPTRANYVEHEVERIIVTYLGAPIDIIAAGVIQQVLSSQSLRNYQENPDAVTEDLKTILRGPRFTTWHPSTKSTLWLMAPGTQLDPSLDLIDRARYYLFELLREQGEVTEGDVTSYLPDRLGPERDVDFARIDIRALLQTLSREVAPHRWRFDSAKVLDYVQLRLLFQPSSVDQLRQRLEQRHRATVERPLRINLENIALLRDRMRAANEKNPDFDRQYRRLIEVLQAVLWRLEHTFGEQVEQVLAASEWAREGIDLRNLPYEEVVLDIIVRAPERSFALSWEIAEQVFTDLRDDDVFIQFQLHTLTEWEHAHALAQARNQIEALGIPLLVRA